MKNYRFFVGTFEFNVHTIIFSGLIMVDDFEVKTIEISRHL